MRRSLSRSPRKVVANGDDLQNTDANESFAAAAAVRDPSSSPTSRASSRRHHRETLCPTFSPPHDDRVGNKNQTTRAAETTAITHATSLDADVDPQCHGSFAIGGPVKSGYLSKLSTGKWKRRRWHQRWFELHSNGELLYYKYAKTSRRQSSSPPHGTYSLQQSGALLTIPMDLPRGTPTPFCFGVTVNGSSLLVCADSELELREWTNVLSSMIHPDDVTDDAMAVAVASATYDELMETSNSDDSPTGATTVSSLSKNAKVKPSTSPCTSLGGFWSSLQAGDVGTALGSLAAVNSVIDVRPSLQNHTMVIPPTAAVASPVKPVAGTVNGSKAVAGCSMKECPTAPAPHVSGCWTQLDATRFNVRKGPSYRRTKAKAPSAPALLTLVATDAYRSDGKIDNIGSVVHLPTPLDGYRRDIVIINCQVPCYTPSNPLWGEQKTDGDGFNFVTYYAIPPALRAKLDDPTQLEPSIKLLRGFLQDGNPITDRLKAIGIVVNPEEQNLGRMEKHLLETYNGQPILTRPQHRFYRGDGYFEVDIDAHTFNFVARKGLSGVADHFGNMVVDFGFVLEGQDDDEVPEQILGCVRLCKVDLKNAPRLA
ncbi:hypothetical protein, variant [Aphanomyces astaci]|uniref:PH domain-containing protein n=1 Tax=Aphanomyces astaci TaxID=112090 RepID=W4H3X1_APHAT|nr:hypothetical protein, variant [Aphanomyces astaci]ETV86567.1 hypothetical protein, variant [Aphanomyces astaci]|eukprot:XP_009823366.1 hypothetical protein, variant [Aphanomyces astaci]